MAGFLDRGKPGRGGRGRPRTTVAQRKILKSGLFNLLRDNTAGMGQAPKWIARYKLKDTKCIFVLMPMDQIYIQSQKQGPFVRGAHLVGNVPDKAVDFMEEMGLVTKNEIDIIRLLNKAPSLRRLYRTDLHKSSYQLLFDDGNPVPNTHIFVEADGRVHMETQVPDLDIEKLFNMMPNDIKRELIMHLDLFRPDAG